MGSLIILLTWKKTTFDKHQKSKKKKREKLLTILQIALSDEEPCYQLTYDELSIDKRTYSRVHRFGKHAPCTQTMGFAPPRNCPRKHCFHAEYLKVLTGRVLFSPIDDF